MRLGGMNWLEQYIVLLKAFSPAKKLHCEKNAWETQIQEWKRGQAGMQRCQGIIKIWQARLIQL